MEELLSAGGVDDESTATARLLVTELASNAVVHAATPLTLRVHVAPGRIRIEVRDANPDRMPTMRPLRSDAITGRGLHFVDRMASSWGVEPDAAGKSVWFELETAAPA